MRRRAALAARDGVGLAVVGLSSPLGIEYLDPADAGPLLRAYHHGVAGLGEPFAGWAAACLTEIDAPGLARLLDRGFVGLQLPATALADEAGYRRCGPLLDVLAGRDRPLFIHPGPAAARGQRRPRPGWWAAVVPYVQQMHAAWFAFRACGRPAYPRLRVCFTALAGLAPLHGERLAARGGTDPLTRGIVDPRHVRGNVELRPPRGGCRAPGARRRRAGPRFRPAVRGAAAHGRAAALRCTTRSAWPTRPGCCTVTRRRPARLPATSGSPRTPASDHPLPARGVTAVTFPALPARYLDQDELTALVDDLAARPEAWRDQVTTAGGTRHFASLHRDEYVDVWLICWSPGNDTGWHDHDLSSGAVRVVRGEITESCPRIGGAHTRAVVPAGQSFSFGPDHIHRLTDEADQAVSLHAYSPPLWRLGQYTIDDDGVLRRISACYADELRPLGAPSAGQPAAQPV